MIGYGVSEDRSQGPRPHEPHNFGRERLEFAVGPVIMLRLSIGPRGVVNNASHGRIAALIWTIADDVLRDLYVRGKYRDVILPFTVLRRLDSVLEPTRDNVVETNKALTAAGIVNQDAALRQAAGQDFYNNSGFTLRDLRSISSAARLKLDFEAYWTGSHRTCRRSSTTSSSGIRSPD